MRLGIRLHLVVAVGRRSKKLHDVGHDLSGVAVLTLLILPLTRFQFALDVALRTGFEVFASRFLQGLSRGRRCAILCW